VFEQHGVDGEDVTSQHCRGLGLQELAPARASSVGGGIEIVALEDVPDAGGGQADSHDGWLAVYPAVAPVRVLLGQADKEVKGASRDLRRPDGFG
jgi:hypothetical protein